MSRKKYKVQLWEEYLAAKKFDEEQQRTLWEIGRLFFDDVTFLYRLHGSLLSHGGAMEDERTRVEYELADTCRILRRGSYEAAFTEVEMGKLVVDMIDLFEDILPLGSVVDLKKEFLEQKLPIQKVKRVRVVITKRFLAGAAGAYYPYAAAIYPIGLGGDAGNLCFTPALIERVVHWGYSDEAEDAFVHWMKRQLILGESRRSVGFTGKGEQEEAEQRNKNGGEQDGRK